jgi:hypothetical protein
MPRYASFGRLDSQIVDDGDRAFQRINQRLRPDQLKPGEVAVSQNARMDVDGAWQTRKGYRNVFATITSGAGAPVLPINLPFDLNDAAVNAIYGTALYSDPNTASTEYIVLATNSSAKLVNASTLAATTVNYPAGNTVDSSCEVVQAFEKLFIFRNGKVAMRWPGFVPTVTAAVRMGNEARLTVSAHHHVLKGDIIIVSGLTFAGGTNPNGTFTVKSVTVTQIRYDCAGSNETFGGVSSAIISSQFALVDNGGYTQPLVYDTASNTDIADGIVTVTASGHEILVGDLVIVSDRGETDLNPLTEYRVYEVTATTFLFKANAADVTGATIAVGKRQSIGLGYTHMPAPPWAIYHQRRLWMPFNYAMTGTSGTPTITNRNTKDEIIASDILDENTYDQIENQFRIASGGADFIVGLQPFAEDNLVVFARNSIHLVTGVGSNLGNASVREITREVGCVSRKSIVQVGNQIFFLSDNGVYAVDFDQLYNLRGVSVPMSEAINPLIKRINVNYAQNAVATYYDNRYYIAVSIDGSTVNNAIFVYNFLNQGWESFDVIDDARWNISGFVRAGAGGINRLYIVSKEGGIHLIDDYITENINDYQDFLCLAVGSAAAYQNIESKLTTRQYTYGTMDRKKFNNYELHLESAENIQSDADLSIEVENPDFTTDEVWSVSGTYGSSIPSNEDLSLRGRLGNKRGYGIQMTIEPTFGRPKVRAVKIGGSIDNGAIANAV